MDIADKTRLAKLLGMLGSAFDGERANAAQMIQKMAESRKMTITELIASAHGVAHKAQPRWEPPPRRPEPPPRREEGNEMLAKLAALVRGKWHGLTDWERQFAGDVGDRYGKDYELSPKQLAIVQRIIGRAERSGVKWKVRP